MFGLGMPEILLILAIALMVIGPKKLPDLAKSLGRALGEFKKAAHEFKNSIDLGDTVKEFNEPVRNIKDDLKVFSDPLKKDSVLLKKTAPVSDLSSAQAAPENLDLNGNVEANVVEPSGGQSLKSYELHSTKSSDLQNAKSYNFQNRDGKEK